MKKRVVLFPTYNVPLGKSIEIIKHGLADERITMNTKVLAIENVANMETHNCVTKDELVGALRWLFMHYEF